MGNDAAIFSVCVWILILWLLDWFLFSLTPRGLLCLLGFHKWQHYELFGWLPQRYCRRCRRLEIKNHLTGEWKVRKCKH